MKNKISFPEIAWLTAAFLVILTTTHSILTKGVMESMPLFALLIVTILFYLYRRRMRLRRTTNRTN